MFLGALAAIIVVTVSGWDYWTWLFGVGPVASRALYLIPAILLFYGLLLRKAITGERFFFSRTDVAVLALLLYLLCQSAFYYILGNADPEGIRGLATFASGVLVFYALAAAASGSRHLEKYLHRSWRWTALTLYVIAIAQSFGQISGLYDLFFDYMRTREYRSIWPVTSLFAEPAILAQFIVADLFARFGSIDELRKNRVALGLAIGAMLLTQSMGGLWGAVFWAMLVGIREGKKYVHPKYFVRAMVVTGVLGTIIVSSLLVARLPAQAILDWDLLDVSGARRIDVEFRTLAYTVSEASSGEVLAGLGDSAAARVRSAAGFSDSVSGNGLIEITFRYGLIGLILTLATVTAEARRRRNLIYLLAGLAILTQIDGAIAKPYLWLYFAAIARGAWGGNPESAQGREIVKKQGPKGAFK